MRLNLICYPITLHSLPSKFANKCPEPTFGSLPGLAYLGKWRLTLDPESHAEHRGTFPPVPASRGKCSRLAILCTATFSLQEGELWVKFCQFYKSTYHPQDIGRIRGICINRDSFFFEANHQSLRCNTPAVKSQALKMWQFLAGQGFAVKWFPHNRKKTWQQWTFHWFQ